MAGSPHCIVRKAALALLAPVPLQGLLGGSLMLALNSPYIFN